MEEIVAKPGRPGGTRPPKQKRRSAQDQDEPVSTPDAAALPTEVVVRATIAQQLSLPTGDITGDLDLRAGLVSDEARLPLLLAAVGEALDVRFPDDFLDGVHTVADLTAAVRVSLSPL